MDWGLRLDRIRRWSRDGERASHKPLLLLYALGRFQVGVTDIAYRDAEADLSQLLREYGPPRPTSAAYPFHHLVSDGLWHVRTAVGGGSPGPVKSRLLAEHAVGCLAPDLKAALVADPSLIARLAYRLLDANFPVSLHADISADVGLEIEIDPAASHTQPGPRRRASSHTLREYVFTAYEYRCAFCGFDGLLAGRPIALEAAHLRWWSHDGPDSLDNLLCLCSMHHKLLDKGVFGIDHDLRILVSRKFVARSAAGRQHVLELAGRPLLGPQPGSPRLHAPHIDWHHTQVFRDDGRQTPRHADDRHDHEGEIPTRR